VEWNGGWRNNSEQIDKWLVFIRKVFLFFLLYHKMEGAKLSDLANMWLSCYYPHHILYVLPWTDFTTQISSVRVLFCMRSNVFQHWQYILKSQSNNMWKQRKTPNLSKSTDKFARTRVFLWVCNAQALSRATSCTFLKHKGARCLLESLSNRLSEMRKCKTGQNNRANFSWVHNAQHATM
jgi:hypothetical protein